MMFRRNPNRRAARERFRALHAEATAADGPRVGDVIRVRRDNASVDVVRVLDTYTSAASGIAMLTVRHSPHGIQTFAIRADAALSDDEPDVRHDATECWPMCETHRIEFAAARDNEWEAGL
jgi:hypothetical protein